MYQWIAWHIPPLIPFSTISSISTSINNYISTPVFFWHTCHSNHGVSRMCAGSSSYISMHWLWKLLNTSVSNSTLLCTYRTQYSSKLCVLKSSQILFHLFIQHSWCLPLSDCCKIVSYLAMMFHWISVKYPCACMNKHF